MTTLSTHDTKRGEDVRARLAVSVRTARRVGARDRRWLPLGSKPGLPRRPLLATSSCRRWSACGHSMSSEPPRYMEKATREAKLATSWAHPDAAYDEAVRTFVGGVFADHELMAEVASFVSMLEPFAHVEFAGPEARAAHHAGRARHLPGQRAGQLPSSSIPTTAGLSTSTSRRAALPLLADEKLRVTANALRLRRDHPDWFVGYTADDRIGAGGRPSRRLCPVELGRVARHPLCRPDLEREGGWRDTTIELPTGAWVDALTGLEHEGGTVAVAEVLRGAPVALLVPGASVEPMTVVRGLGTGRPRVELAVERRHNAMQAADGGWWAAEVDDDRDLRLLPRRRHRAARPRSRWQPDGVHGLSRLVDHEQFDWQATQWRGRVSARPRRSTSCTSAPLPTKARSTRRSGGSTTWSTSASTSSNCCRLRHFPAARLGLRRRVLVRRARPVRRPRSGLEAVRRRLPSARPRRCARRRLQPPRP